MLSAHHRFERVAILEQDVRERFAGRFGASFGHQMFGEQTAKFGGVGRSSEQLFHGTPCGRGGFAEQTGATASGLPCIRRAIAGSSNCWMPMTPRAGSPRYMRLTRR